MLIQKHILRQITATFPGNNFFLNFAAIPLFCIYILYLRSNLIDIILILIFFKSNTYQLLFCTMTFMNKIINLASHSTYLLHAGILYVFERRYLSTVWKLYDRINVKPFFILVKHHFPIHFSNRVDQTSCAPVWRHWIAHILQRLLFLKIERKIKPYFSLSGVVFTEISNNFGFS